MDEFTLTNRISTTVATDTALGTAVRGARGRADVAAFAPSFARQYPRLSITRSLSLA